MKVRIGDEIVWRTVAGEVLITNLETETYYGLDGAGPRIWELLVERGETGEAAAALAREFDCDEAALRADLEMLVRELERKGIVELVTDRRASGRR
jgi:predicted DNA-binding WGR domain protein